MYLENYGNSGLLSPIVSPIAAADEFPPFGAAIPRQQADKFVIFIGLAWGLLTGFAARIAVAWGYAYAMQLTMVAGLAVAVVLGVIYFRSLMPLFSVFTRIAGVLVVIHAMMAVLSAAIGETAQLVLLARYVVLAFAFSVMVCVRLQGLPAAAGMRMGLTIAGLCVVLYHLPFVTAAQLLNPSERISLYLNPNAAAIICYGASLSLLDYAFQSWRAGRRGSTAALLLLTLAAGIVLLATKSRTAMAAMMAGVFMLSILHLRPRQIVPIVLIALAVVLAVPALRDALLHVYQLDNSAQHWRDSSTFTGRTVIWQAFWQAFLDHPVLGAGAGSLIASDGMVFAHNALLNYLGECGLAGTAPLLILLAMAVAGAMRRRRDPRFAFAIAMLTASLVGSLAESELFSSGNPTGLLFLLAVVMLAVPGREEESMAEFHRRDDSFDGSAEAFAY